MKLLRVVVLLIIIGISVLRVINNHHLGDYGSFVAAGHALAGGRDPYSNWEPLVNYVFHTDIDLSAPAPNLNPPISLPFCSLAASGDPRVAKNVWRGLSLALYIAAIALMARFSPRRVTPVRTLWALSLAGLWQMLGTGQIYAPLVLMAAGAWVLLHRRHSLWAGILIGCIVAFKPNFAVWPLFLFLSGDILAGVGAVGSAGALSLVPVLLYGPGIYTRWLQASSAYAGLAFAGNSSFVGLAVRYGVPQVGIYAGVVAILAVGYVVWRRRPGVTAAGSLGILVALLASPIAWAGYTLMLIPVLLWADWDAPKRVGACILAVPVWCVLLLFEESFFWFVFAGWLYGWAILLLLASVLSGIARAPAPLLGAATPTPLAGDRLP